MQPGMGPAPFLYPANMAQAQRGFFPAAAGMGQMGQMGMMQRPPPRWNNQQYARQQQPGGGPYQQQMPGMQGNFRGQGPRGMRPTGTGMGAPRGMQPGGVPNMGQMPHGPQRMTGANVMQQGPPRPQNGIPGQSPGAGLRTGAPAFIRPAGVGQPMTQRGPAPNAQQPQQNVNISGIDPSSLAKASSSDQKQMLGEKLFPLIAQVYPDLAGKVTGMLLEIDNAELLLMLEQPDQLKNKVDEAVVVLKSHLQAAPGAAVSGKTGAGDTAIKQEGQK
jgi:polyadenylate-binding protein